MSKKQPRVPETRDRPTTNREWRRHPEQVSDEAVSRDRDAPRDETPPDQQAPPKRQKVFREGPQDVSSTRAKSSGHGKKTADKWNQ